jgi:hypothetical protein
LRSALVALSLTLALAPALAGQALHASELDLAPLSTWARHDFYGISVGFARRPGGQGRIAAVASGGSSGGRLALRLEASAQLIVMPVARTGVSPYGGLGVAYVGVRGRRGTGVLLALLGLEAAPGNAHGWFAELGLGGGTRLRVGYRWRSLPPWWS